MFQYLEPMANDTRFLRAASSLAGSVVRVGGITADWTYYAGFAGGEAEEAPPQPLPLSRGAIVPRGAAVRAGAAPPFWPSAPANFTRASFETLLAFFNATGLKLVFDLNELLGCVPLCAPPAATPRRAPLGAAKHHAQHTHPAAATAR